MEIEIDLKKLRLNIQPHVMAGLLNLDDDSDASFTKLDHLVRSDQNMTALILKAANSSLYSRGKEVTTLQHAIAILGFQVVRTLSMTAASKAIFESGNYSRFRRLVWEHSVVTGIIARDVAHRLNKKEYQEEAFIAGLLHDLGKVLLNAADRKQFIAVINMVNEEKVPFSVAEDKLFGVNHMEIGARACREWSLPEIYEPVMSMHEGLDRDSLGEGDYTLLYLVSYANYLAKKMEFGYLAPDDEKDGALLEELLQISDKDKKYFGEDYRRVISGNDFYKFFMTVI